MLAELKLILCNLLHSVHLPAFILSRACIPYLHDCNDTVFDSALFIYMVMSETLVVEEGSLGINWWKVSANIT